MKIFHGSKMIIEKPLPHGSASANDYGPSFYLTLDVEAAKSWACRNGSVGIVNEYHVDDRKYRQLKVLDLTDKEGYGVLNWIAILMHFRNLDSSFVRTNGAVLEWLSQYYVDVNDYDVVIGYRADDSYFRFPLRFMTGDLAYDDLERIYRSGDLGIQYAFMSEKAIGLLEYRSCFQCDDAYLGHYFSIVKEATRRFDELIMMPKDPKKTYVLDLMRREHE